MSDGYDDSAERWTLTRLGAAVLAGAPKLGRQASDEILIEIDLQQLILRSDRTYTREASFAHACRSRGVHSSEGQKKH
jgi:hypothetical protein